MHFNYVLQGLINVVFTPSPHAKHRDCAGHTHANWIRSCTREKHFDITYGDPHIDGLMAIMKYTRIN